MADVTATEKYIENGHDQKWQFKGGGTGYSDGDDVVLRSKDTYGEATGELVEAIWGDTDNVVYGGQLLQKMIHIAALLCFYIGNRMGFSAVVEKGKRPNALGVAL